MKPPIAWQVGSASRPSLLRSPIQGWAIILPSHRGSRGAVGPAAHPALGRSSWNHHEITMNPPWNHHDSPLVTMKPLWNKSPWFTMKPLWTPYEITRYSDKIHIFWTCAILIELPLRTTRLRRFRFVSRKLMVALLLQWIKPIFFLQFRICILLNGIRNMISSYIVCV